MAVGFMRDCCQCTGLDSGTGRDWLVARVIVVNGALRAEAAGGLVNVIVGSSKDTIVGLMLITL
jgi:hypothetical protein